MPRYVFRGEIDRDDAARRSEVRPAHLAYQDTMTNLLAGPLTDDRGAPIGTMIVFDAPDRAAAEARVIADPYIIEGVVRAWTLDVIVPLVWPGERSP